MALQTIEGMTIVAPWQLGGTASISIPLQDGTERQIHFIKSSPSQEDRPDKELFHVCEWDAIGARYRPPPEAPPEGVVVAPIFGSNRGDAGWRLPGEKHGFIWPRIRQFSYESRLLQVLYSTRMPDAPSGAPFMLVLINLPVPVPPIADFASVARTLQTEIAALRRDVQRALGFEQRIAKMEQGMGALTAQNTAQGQQIAALTQRLTEIEARLGEGGEAALEGRVVKLENARAKVREALGE